MAKWLDTGFQRLALVGGFLGGLAAIGAFVWPLIETGGDIAADIEIQYIRVVDDTLLKLARRDKAIMDDLGWPGFLQDDLTTMVLRESTQEYIEQNGRSLHSASFLYVLNKGQRQIDSIALLDPDGGVLGETRNVSANRGFLTTITLKHLGDAAPKQNTVSGLQIVLNGEITKKPIPPMPTLNQLVLSSKNRGLYRGYPDLTRN